MIISMKSQKIFMIDKKFSLNISVMALILIAAIFVFNFGGVVPTGYAVGCTTTCAFKDDFNDNSFDSSLWTRTSPSTIIEENQAINGTSTGSYQTLQTIKTFTGAGEFGALIKKSTSPELGWVKVTITDSGADFDTGQNGGQMMFDPLDGKFSAHIKVGGVLTDYRSTISYSADTYYWFIIKRNSDGTLTFRVEDSNHGLISEKTTTQAIPNSTALKFNPIEVAQSVGSVDEIYIDDYATPVATSSTTTTTSSTTTTIPPTTTTQNTCSVPRGTGNYVGGACTVISCDSGYYNCDGNNVNGCEATASCATTTTSAPTTTYATTTTTVEISETTTTTLPTTETMSDEEEAGEFITSADERILLASKDSKNTTALEKAKALLGEAKDFSSRGEYLSARESALAAIILAEDNRKVDFISYVETFYLLSVAVVIVAILAMAIVAIIFITRKKEEAVGEKENKNKKIKKKDGRGD